MTFERGTAISYRDRRHVFISGTASIDPQGRILHPDDIGRQLARTLDNIAALLSAAGATLRDVQVFIAYVRQPADLALVRQGLREACGDVPAEVFVAPICRRGWLVEIEALAAIRLPQSRLPEF